MSRIVAFFNGGHVIQATGCNIIYTDSNGAVIGSEHLPKNACGNELDSILQWRELNRVAPQLNNGFEVKGTINSDPFKWLLRKIHGNVFYAASINGGKWTAEPIAADTAFTPQSNTGKLPFGSQAPKDPQRLTLGGLPTWLKVAGAVSIAIAIYFAFNRLIKIL